MRRALAAALGLLAEVGYDRLTMEAVAARVQASKATLYRRWPGKAELVVDAVRAHGGDGTPGGDGDPLVPSDTGSLRGDLAGDVDTALSVEINSAMLFSRLFVTGEPLDDAFVRHLVDAVLIPLLTGGRPAPGPPADRPTTQGDQ
ncbi:TetR family transcriptional regulator [Actinomadura rifamycini]|uniref:TetR family transcriptional regulator n=1 Tax=Actinomadura rifamycini TaxID=31962 RepID=UPI000418D1D8